MAANWDLKVLQINLQHSKGGTAALSRLLHRQEADLVLIQEPYLYKGGVSGLGGTGGKLTYARNVKNPRTCIYVKNDISFLPMVDFCSRDLVTIRLKQHMEGSSREFVLASAYLPYEVNSPPSQEVRRLVNSCMELKKQLLIGIDTNAHNLVWGSKDTNSRGEYLLEFLVESNLEILNRGQEPTFRNAVR